jgi:hypothetical protein
MKRNLFSLVLYCFLFFSCVKNKDSRYDCGPTPMCPMVACFAYWSNFNFTLIDGITGKDLLFGNNPTLTPADIKLYAKSNSAYIEIKIFADSSKNSMITLTASDTMALQIKNEPLQYILVKNFCSNECCSRTAVELFYEGRLLIADEKKLIRIKR